MPLQVHAARLSSETLRDLGWRWPLGSNVVLKVQHDDMRCLMDSDVRNLGRLAAFVRDSMPFDAIPVRSPAMSSLRSACKVCRCKCVVLDAEL